jgi:transcriptional regulator with XRE-family HTH domain
MKLPRNDIAPIWTRSFPITKEPKTLGQHLKKKRFAESLRQSEVAEKLGVSSRTLSLWECDQIYPTWAYWPCVATYLGFDPFNDPKLGNPKSNESLDVAYFTPETLLSLGERVRRFRLKSRKTRQQLAKEWDICPKTLWSWENDIRKPSPLLKKRMTGFNLDA